MKILFRNGCRGGGSWATPERAGFVIVPMGCPELQAANGDGEVDGTISSSGRFTFPPPQAQVQGQCQNQTPAGRVAAARSRYESSRHDPSKIGFYRITSVTAGLQRLCDSHLRLSKSHSLSAGTVVRATRCKVEAQAQQTAGGVPSQAHSPDCDCLVVSSIAGLGVIMRAGTSTGKQ
ncbi:MAG: hypothetical protein IT427_03385 [Pirellulales bacterium]|nr:hypothetical protein [Pirellulales bacterium]